jgi:hypothetical protein
VKMLKLLLETLGKHHHRRLHSKNWHKGMSKLKCFWVAREIIAKVKKQATECEKLMLAIHLIRIWDSKQKIKNCKKNSRKTNSINKWANVLDGSQKNQYKWPENAWNKCWISLPMG